ncbi:MAG: GNAT family N-acetyltransferase [Bacteroidetes bacterium]|nr:GNAT family N-acetyltransferase [Bacteroidota bacterium]
MSITFRSATTGDIQLINDLAHRIWWQHYPDIISDDQIRYMLDKMYSPAAILTQMEAAQHYTLIYDGVTPVGYYAISEKSPRHFFLHKFYIDTTQHRKGIGAAAFRKILSDCTGYEEIALQVNRRNIKAVNFYFKQGFTIAYAKDFDFGGGYTMDDFWMIKKP